MGGGGGGGESVKREQGWIAGRGGQKTLTMCGHPLLNGPFDKINTLLFIKNSF